MRRGKGISNAIEKKKEMARSRTKSWQNVWYLISIVGEALPIWVSVQLIYKFNDSDARQCINSVNVRIVMY